MPETPQPTIAPSPEPQRQRWAVRVALIAILVVAALLRVHGLSWGLRHVPDQDESVFVDATRAMIRAGDFDHRFYEYPGLFIYLLAPVLAFFPARGPIDPAAFLAVRTLIAAFSVVSVALVFFLARRLAGVSAGLLAAALMAVAPIEVWTMHMLRSDVALEAFALASLLWFHCMRDRRRDDIWSGVAVGLTAAIKFTGVLIAPAYVAARCTRSGWRWGRMLLAGVVSALVWFAVTPYALIKPTAYLAGVWTQTDYFYGGTRIAPEFLAYVGFYVRAILRGMGALPGGLGGPSTLVPVPACALFGLVALRRAWRAWLPLVVYPATLILVLATAESRLSRLALSCVGPLAVMAGVGLAALLKRWPVLGSALTLWILGIPLLSSVEVGRQFAAPSPMDRALDWVETHVPRGARILSGVPRLGLDANHEVVRAEALSDGDGAWAAGMDWTVVEGAAPQAWREDMRLLAAFDDEQQMHRVRIEILAPRPSVWRSVAVQPSWLRASTSQAQLPALVDGSLRTVWRTPGPQEPGTWIEIEFPHPQSIDRIEMVLGMREESARAFDVYVRDANGDWTRPAVFGGRPLPRDQTGGPPSQVCLLRVAHVNGVRIALRKGALQPWSIAELRLAVRETLAPNSSGSTTGVAR